jgi:hypothetical protein
MPALKGDAGGRSLSSKKASPPATVDRMAGVQWPPIQANIGTETACLDEPLRGVVSTLA